MGIGVCVCVRVHACVCVCFFIDNMLHHMKWYYMLYNIYHIYLFKYKQVFR